MYPFPYTYYSPFGDRIPENIFQRPPHRPPEYGGIEDFFRPFYPRVVERRKPNIDDHLRLSPSPHRHRTTSAENYNSPQIPPSLVRRLNPSRRDDIFNLLSRFEGDNDYEDEDEDEDKNITIQDMRMKPQKHLQEEESNARKLNRTSSNSEILHKSERNNLSNKNESKQQTQSEPRKSSDQMLRDRLKLYGLKEKTKIKGDGNCQFASCADQLFDDSSRYPEVRKAAVEWLSKNKDYILPNGTAIGDYLQTEFFPNWTDYIEYMAQDSIWGDHFTLLAIAEVYQSKVVIVSSMDVDPGIDPFTVIVPKKWNKTIYVSHLHELHYSSLCPDDE